MECGLGNFLLMFAKKIESTIHPVIGLGLHSSVIEDVDHEAWWLAC